MYRAKDDTVYVEGLTKEWPRPSTNIKTKVNMKRIRKTTDRQLDSGSMVGLEVSMTLEVPMTLQV